MTMKTWIAGLAIGAAFIGAAQAQQTVKIGISGPFTGGSASMGVSMRDGVKLAAQEINKAGGILGKQIQLVERDDEAKNELGVQIAQELINKEQVVATVGFINTGVSLASQRFYQEAEIPVMNNVSTGTLVTQQFKAPEHKANYVFRNSANDTIQSAMIAEAVKKAGYTKVAIIADFDELWAAGPGRPGKGACRARSQARRDREIQYRRYRHDRPGPARQGCRRRCRADLRDRPGASADRQRHCQARLEGSGDGFLDAVDGELHRCGWRQWRRRDDAPNFHPAAVHPQAQELHRGLSGSLQGRPHSLPGLSRAGL